MMTRSYLCSQSPQLSSFSRTKSRMLGIQRTITLETRGSMKQQKNHSANDSSLFSHLNHRTYDPSLLPHYRRYCTPTFPRNGQVFSTSPCNYFNHKMLVTFSLDCNASLVFAAFTDSRAVASAETSRRLLQCAFLHSCKCVPG